MSAAPRRLLLPRGQRRERDFYPTPVWATLSFLRHPNVFDHMSDRSYLFTDPCCGDGAIADALSALRKKYYAPGHHIYLADIEPGPRAVERYGARIENFLGDSARIDVTDVCLTNPPFTYALEFVQRAVSLFPLTAMLLPLSFLESAKRASWLRAHPPTLYVHPSRIDFVARGTPFGCAWFVWSGPNECFDETNRGLCRIADGAVHILEEVRNG